MRDRYDPIKIKKLAYTQLFSELLLISVAILYALDWIYFFFGFLGLIIFSSFNIVLGSMIRNETMYASMINFLFSILVLFSLYEHILAYAIAGISSINILELSRKF